MTIAKYLQLKNLLAKVEGPVLNRAPTTTTPSPGSHPGADLASICKTGPIRVFPRPSLPNWLRFCKNGMPTRPGSPTARDGFEL